MGVENDELASDDEADLLGVVNGDGLLDLIFNRFPFCFDIADAMGTQNIFSLTWLVTFPFETASSSSSSFVPSSLYSLDSPLRSIT